MCNLAERIEEEAIEKGRIEGILEGKLEEKRNMILKTNAIGLSIDVICECVDLSFEEVQKVLYQFV